MKTRIFNLIYFDEGSKYRLSGKLYSEFSKFKKIFYSKSVVVCDLEPQIILTLQPSNQDEISCN